MSHEKCDGATLTESIIPSLTTIEAGTISLLTSARSAPIEKLLLTSEAGLTAS